jgi:protein-S-isoprenylcysteine O-methyltransferase Ste14
MDVVSISESKAATVVRSPSALSYDRIPQLLGSLWFFLLALAVAAGIAFSPHMLWASRLSNFLLALFYTLVALLMMTRPAAKARVKGVLPKIAAFVGTYMIWTVSFFGKTNDPTLNLTSSVFLLIGAVMMLVTLRHLGRAFSLTPQARQVVQTGPYRWIRHPLYLWEEFAVVGVVLKSPSLVTAIILVVHVGVQICRILYEEELLRRTCPEYASYAASRWRLVPYVW